jgi:hypothetical protein
MFDQEEMMGLGLGDAVIILSHRQNSKMHVLFD